MEKGRYKFLIIIIIIIIIMGKEQVGPLSTLTVLNLQKMLRLPPETKKTVLINKVFVLSGCS